MNTSKQEFYYSRILLSIFSVFVVAGFYGCTDTSEKVLGTVTDNNFLQSEEEFAAVSGSAYTNLYTQYTNTYGFLGMQTVSADELVVPQRGQDWYAGGTLIRLKQHTYTPDEPMLNDTWNYLYSGVNICNRLIFQFEQTAEGETVEAVLAELRALRALYYYFLLDLYGNVPIVDKFDVPTDFAPSNNTRQEVYNFVESEVLNSLDLLSKDTGQSTYGRMNYYAAQALLAKLYLNAEVYTGTAQWEKAAAAAGEIINSGLYSLMNDYFENFSADNSYLPESILAIPFDEVFAQGNTIAVSSLHYSSQQTFNLKQQPWNGFSTLKEFYELYDENDVRRESFLVGPQFTSTGEPLIDPGAEPNDPDGPQVVYTLEVNELAPGALRQAGARIAKFEIAMGSDPGNMSNDLHIFRYADILLTRAEALWRINNNDPEALMLVNLVRNRAGVFDYTSLTAENLLAERGREMFAEHKRRQDMIRFGTFNDEFRFHEPDPSDHVNIFPIPTSQLNSNPNLAQNPGY